MKILEYDEVDKEQVLQLNFNSFNWFLTPEQVKTIRKVDKSVPDYFSIYAVEEGEVLSQVGVVEIDTQTTHGLERVGYVWGVCTRADAARKGFARILMKEIHTRLPRDDVRYACLGTGKSLVAYNLYRKLGYADFEHGFWGIKKGYSLKGNENEISFTSKAKDQDFLTLFKKYSEGLLGYEPIGYVLATMRGKFFGIRELICPNVENMKKCVEILEREFKPEYITFDSVSKYSIAEEYVKCGFKKINVSWGTFMMKDLKEKQNIKHI